MDQKPRSKSEKRDHNGIELQAVSEQLNDDDLLAKTTSGPSLRALSKRLPSKKSYNSWITSNFTCRKCTLYIPNSEKNGNLDPDCCCGRRKLNHSEYDLSDVSGRAIWTSDECTSESPTDAFGEVQFPGSHSQNKSPYVRLSHNTNATLILDLMLKQWGLKVPNLVISVTGGAKSFEINHHLKDVFRRGLMKAAKSTGAWIITGGTNDGVMKHVGEAVKEHQLMLGTDSDVKVIGIASWGQIQNKEALKGQGRYPAVYRMESSQNNVGARLDPNHTHFILVDDGSENHWGVEIGLRSRIEEAIMNLQTDSRSIQGSIEVPVVLLVLEGGPNTIKTMNEVIQKKVPVVIIDGSGRAANLVAFAQRHTIPKKKKAQNKTMWEIDPIYQNDIKSKLKKICKENEVNEFYDMINQILEDEMMVSVYRLDTSISQDIDLAILKALLKANQSSKLAQLNLALAWKRSDLAKSDIFTDNRLWTTNELSGAMFTALLDDKPDFVELILRNGLNIKEFLSNEFLCKLYEVVPLIVQKTMFQKSSSSMQRVGKIIENLMGGIYVSHFSSDTWHDKYLSTKKLKQRKISMPSLLSGYSNSDYQTPTPHLDVFIWAVLCNRQELARVLWEGIMQPIAAALMAARLLRSMAKKAHTDESNTDSLLQHALIFEERATGILDECFKMKEAYCELLLIRELEDFSNFTCLDLAVLSKSENFISHTMCQRFLSRLWMGTMTINNSYKQVVVCMFLPFFIPLILSFVDDDEYQDAAHKQRSTSIVNDQDEDEDDIAFSGIVPDLRQNRAVEYMLRSKNLDICKKVSSFYLAPITKFVGTFISNMVFLVLYAYVLMINFPKFDSNKRLGGISAVEILLYFWVFSVVIEEIRQIGSKNTEVFLQKVHIYLYDPWNWNSIDILSVAAFFMAVALRFITNEKIFSTAHIILTVGIVLFIARSLQMFFVNRHVGPRLVMIGKMMRDLIHFVFILLVFLVAYGISLEAVMFPGPGPYARNDTWKSIQGVLELPYWQMYGELFLDEIKGRNPDEFGKVSPLGQWLSPLLLALFMLVANVLLLNLLIAIFSNTFQGIQEASDKLWRFQRYDLVQEYHNKPLLPPPLILISHVFVLTRWICLHCGSRDSGERERSPMKFIPKPEEKELIDNWEFQAAETYILQKKNDTSGVMDERLRALKERVDCMATMNDVGRLEEKLNKILKLLEGNTSKGIKPAQKIRKHSGIPGLVNFGNSCWWNCILQCICSLNLSTHMIENMDISRDENVVLRELVDVLVTMKTVPTDSRATVSLHQGLYQRLLHNHGWVERQQQDAEEGLLFLIDDFTPHDTSSATVTRNNFSLLLSSYKVCLECNEKQRLQNEAMVTYPVSFSAKAARKDSIQDMMKGNFEVEILKNDIECKKCGKRTRHYKYSEIQYHPDVLILSLKRYSSSGRKVKKRVEIEKMLDLDFGQHKDHRREDNLLSQKKKLYELKGVILHVGEDLNHGHYKAILLKDNCILEADDEVVTEFPDDYLKEGNIERSCYMLFYERTEVKSNFSQEANRTSTNEELENDIQDSDETVNRISIDKDEMECNDAEETNRSSSNEESENDIKARISIDKDEME